MTRQDKVSIWLTSISVITLFASNLLATKLTTVAGIAVDCGIILYPISYVVGDLSIEFLGKNRANLILYVAALLNILAAIFLSIAVALPAYPGWDGQAAFAAIFTFMPRVILGSVFAYLASGLTNNRVFERIRTRHPDSLAARILGSSLIARLIDTLVFETIAFLGVLSFREFLAQATFAYCAGSVIECVLYNFITHPAHRAIQHYLHHSPN